MPAQQQEAAEIKIPPIALKRITVTIRGAAPLLCDRFTEQAQGDIEERQQGAARRPKAPRDPEAEWRGKLYVIDADAQRYGFPGAGLKKALVRAGSYADEQMTQLRGLFNIAAELVEIRGSTPRLHKAMGRLQGKTSTPVYRAVYDQWEMDVPVVFNADLITDAEVVNLFQIAGFSVGIGPWRPEKSGTFGTFEPVGAK